jgi:hypothetical protein
LQGKVYIGTYGGGMYVFDRETKKIDDLSRKADAFVNGHLFVLLPKRIIIMDRDIQWVFTVIRTGNYRTFFQ